jgi:hypothetical protein
MTKSPTRESTPQRSERPQPRHRNVYDCDGEYEFAIARHWTAPEVTPFPGKTGAHTLVVPIARPDPPPTKRESRSGGSAAASVCTRCREGGTASAGNF